MRTVSPADFQRSFFQKNPALGPLFLLMANAPAACLFVKDTESRYVRANRGALATYDLAREEDLIGKRARDFFPALLADAYEAEDRRVFEAGEAILNEIWLVPHIRGTPRWFVSSKAPVFDTAGKVIGLAGLMHPIAAPEDRRAHFQELQRVMDHLETRYTDDVTLERLAEIAKLSVPHFTRRFRQLLRLSPMQYVLSLRVQEAQRLLATTDKSVGEIALATGFYDQSHFTKRFRRIAGMTPLAYRKQFRA